MDRRIVAINNWITARYFKEADLQVFIRNIKELEKHKISISPSVKISAPANARKTADILLCTGADEKEVTKKIGSEKLVLNYLWGEKYEVYTLIEKGELFDLIDRKDGIKKLYKTIAEQILSITDSEVEMRGIKEGH